MDTNNTRSRPCEFLPLLTVTYQHVPQEYRETFSKSHNEMQFSNRQLKLSDRPIKILHSTNRTTRSNRQSQTGVMPQD